MVHGSGDNKQAIIGTCGRKMEEDKGLQGMRGWASIMVMCFHIVTNLPFVIPLLLFPLYSGYSGVYLFFLISGYILMRKIDSEDYKSRGKFDATKYYLRRIFRIWPLYFIAIPLFAQEYGIPIIWQDFLFVQNYLPSTWAWTPAWTLLIEEFFYLILPLWAIAFRKNWLYSLIGMFGLSLGYVLLVVKMYGSLSLFSFGQFPMFAFCYALGTIAARGKVLKVGWGIILAIWLFASTIFLGTQSAIGVLIFSVVYFLVLGNMKESRVFTNRVSGFLGSLAYPIYILGMPVKFFLVWRLGISNLMWIPLAVFITIGLAYVLHRSVERPLIGLGRRIESRISTALE